MGTCILDGLRTSKEAVALKEKEANGLERVVALTIVMLLESISWDIFSTFNSGIVPIATRGTSSENAVYLKQFNKKNMNQPVTSSSTNNK